MEMPNLKASQDLQHGIKTKAIQKILQTALTDKPGFESITNIDLPVIIKIRKNGIQRNAKSQSITKTYIDDIETKSIQNKLKTESTDKPGFESITNIDIPVIIKI